MKNCNNQCSCINPNNKPALCECEYLKPLSIDSLFSNNNDYEICDVLDKTKKIRNSFFTIKTAIKNYIDECTILFDEMVSNSSLNYEMLANMKQRYVNSINNLILAIYSAIKVSYNNIAVLNSAYSKFSCKEYKCVPESSLLKLKKYKNQDNIVVVAQLPGILIQYNESSKEVQLKFRVCENNSLDVCNIDSYKNNNTDTIKKFKIGPSILTNIDLSDNDISDNNLSNMNVFDNIDLARDFMEEIVNNCDLDNDVSSFGNQICDLMTYLDDSIIKIENVHKYVVQICKIESS